jgi:addiction module HigA family antidote
MSNTEQRVEETIPTPSIGEILTEEFLQPLEITPYRLAKELHVSTSTILDLLHGKRQLSTDMALRLSRFFGMSERFWINLQASIEVRNRKRALEKELEKIHPIRNTA